LSELKINSFTSRDDTTMADSRSVNSEYALDVDEMILEYLLYNTTKAHLHELRSRERPGCGTESPPTLLQVFDQFLKQFKLNHPDYDFSPDTEFSIKLLQFVLLFKYRISPEELSPSLQDQLKRLSKQNSAIRMKWWDTRHATDRQSSREDSVLDSWRNFLTTTASAGKEEQTALPGNLHSGAAKFIPLLELLPHFLDLSANMAANLGQDVTQQWMELAAEFMLQSAWENHVHLDAESDGESLKVAFGWGRWAQEEELDGIATSADAGGEAKAVEVCVDAMFSTGDGSSGRAAGQEIPEWTDVKLEYLSAFGTLPDGEEATEQAQIWQVKRLREIAERFPKEVFDGKIVDYLGGLWKLGKKPLLVQIEEGKIDGLTKEEFEEFMLNVFPKGSGGQEIGQGGKWWN
jgi:hypothetical protein